MARDAVEAAERGCSYPLLCRIPGISLISLSSWTDLFQLLFFKLLHFFPTRERGSWTTWLRINWSIHPLCDHETFSTSFIVSVIYFHPPYCVISDDWHNLTRAVYSTIRSSNNFIGGLSNFLLELLTNFCKFHSKV